MPEQSTPENQPTARRLSLLGPSRVEGIPGRYDDGFSWLRNGLRRFLGESGVALVLAWSGTWLALWGAVGGAILGTFTALGVISSPSVSSHLFNLGLGQGVTALSVATGFVFGLVGGLVWVIDVLIIDHPISAVISVASGAVVAVVITLVIATCERLALRLRGYRRLSRDEVRRIAPLVKEVADQMELDALPRFAMADSFVPSAWTHMRTVVLSTGLLQTLDDGELSAILAHEFHHWRSGDAVGLRIVWACASPIALLYNLGTVISGNKPREKAEQKKRAAPGRSPQGRGVAAFFGWFIAWPAWVMLTLIIAPLVASAQRFYEYEADHAAAEIGRADGLISALRKMGVFENGRTGWEQVITATHPPIELRIEALQAPKPDDAQYQENDLQGPTWREFFRMFGVFR